MIHAILFGMLATGVGILFWIFLVMLIVKIVRKKPKKGVAVGLSVFGSLWIIFNFYALFLGAKALIDDDPIAGKILERIGTAGTNIAVNSAENLKKGRNKVLLKRIEKLSVSFVSIREVSEDEKELFDFSDANGKKIFEILLSIENPLDFSKKIPYRKINKEQLIFARDTNGNYMPVFIIDDSGLSTVPWILTFLLPTYRKDRASMYIPTGKSELRLRIDAESKNSIEKIIFGNTEVLIPSTENSKTTPSESA